MVKKNVNKRKVLYICISVVLCIYAISMLIPCWFLLVNSFKDLSEYRLSGNIWGLPGTWTFENFVTAFTYEKYNIGMLYVNSIWFTILSVGLATVATVLVAYACGRFDFTGKSLIVAIGVGALVFPDFGSSSVIYRLFKDLNWLGTPFVLLPKGSPFGLMFLILYSQFKTVSKTYAEAAKIDGASELRIFLQIMVPMVKGPIGMMMVMSAIGAWNDYYTPYMYFAGEMPTLTLGMQSIATDIDLKNNLPVMCAMMTICVVPLMVLFITMRDVIIENTAAGGIKG
ncbi:MAG: carbohydrate ABC transporter permease [Clostridia bacterium]|nr:carbohydrate ABC transporter permease [Clostridia bacterium]